jgi:hypothetical protein
MGLHTGQDGVPIPQPLIAVNRFGHKLAILGVKQGCPGVFSQDEEGLTSLGEVPDFLEDPRGPLVLLGGEKALCRLLLEAN